MAMRVPSESAKAPEVKQRKTYKSIVRFPSKNWTYIREITSVYDPKIQNMRPIGYLTLGKLPPGEKDLKNMVPVGKRGRKKKAEIAHDKLRNFLKPLEQIRDTRNPLRIVYPLKLVLLVAIVAAMFGKTSCGEVAEMWKASRPVFEKFYPDYPKSDISHDTVRLLIEMIGKQGHANLIEEYAKKLVDKLERRIVAVDGQAVKASRNEEDRRPYFLNVYDADSEVILTHELIGAKSNEIAYAAEVVSRLDIEGAIVTCDAMNTQRKFAKTICSKGGDYLFALKENQESLCKQVKSLFAGHRQTRNAETRIEEIAGRIESRDVKVLPAKLLTPGLSEKWMGLEEGCIVRATTRSQNKKTGQSAEPLVRYYITSLRYDTPYIEEVLMRSIRRHWAIESNCHWILDVIFDQDRLQCKNGAYLAGRVALNKIGSNFLTRLQTMIEKEEGKSLSRPEVQARFHSPEKMVEKLLDCIS